MRDIEDILNDLPWVAEFRRLMIEARHDSNFKAQARTAYKRMLLLNKPVIKAYADVARCPLLK